MTNVTVYIWLAILFSIVVGLLLGLVAGFDERVMEPSAEQAKVSMASEERHFPYRATYIFNPLTEERIP
jgi:hypothetical protein